MIDLVVIIPERGFLSMKFLKKFHPEPPAIFSSGEGVLDFFNWALFHPLDEVGGDFTAGEEHAAEYRAHSGASKHGIGAHPACI